MRKLWVYGMIALGAATFGCAASYARDEPKDGIGPINSFQDVQDTAKMFFKLADTNNDGQISQKEAVDVGNLLVGGFFFRADTNGDGVLSQEEARQARESLFAQQPLLEACVRKGQADGRAWNEPTCRADHVWHDQ